MTRIWLMVLALITASAGCLPRESQYGGAAPQPAQPSHLAESAALVEADGPPTPAPALYIPGKPRELELASVSFVPAGPKAPDLNISGAKLAPPLPLVVAAAAAQPAAAEESPMRALYTKAAKKYSTMDTYIMRLRRREVIGDSARPEELMQCKVRKEPFSVYFKWLGAEGKDREVIYVKGKYGNLIHSLTAAGDVLFLPAGKRFKVAPDSFLVKSKSRYPITEAGLGPMINRYGRLVAAVEKGDPREGTAKHVGLTKRPEYEKPVECVVQSMPPRTDPLLPRGGQRLWYFDTDLQLPVLLVTFDERGREVEYYCHDRFIIPAKLTDDDFNPDVLWGK